MPSYYVVEELHSYLIAQGVGQAPNTQPSATVPSVWIQPRDGARLPGKPRGGFDASAAKVETSTITLIDVQTNAPMMSGLEAYIDESYIDIIVRSKTAAPCKQIHRQIRDLLHPAGDLFARKDWQMGNVSVEYSSVWRPEQPLNFPTEAEVQTYDRVAGYRIGVRRANLSS